MNKNLIVEIFVPERGTGGEEGEIATGYPVTSNLILTARHPLYPEAGRDVGRDVEVRWRHPAVPAGQWFATRGIAWESERWDLALLECNLPDGVTGWGFISEQKPDDRMFWSSAGFPQVSKREGMRDAFPMKGTVFSMADIAERFDLEATAGPKVERDWKGASGSPVFVNWRIIGVIVSVPGRLEAARLQAVPIWRLLREDEGFRRTIGYEQGQDRQRKFRRQLARLMAPAAEALEVMAELTPGAADELLGKKVRQKADCLAERLLQLEVGEAIRVCNEAYDELQHDESAARAVVDAMNLILPAIYDHGVVETVRSSNDAKAAFLSLPVHHPTVAEIVMAGADCRRATFCPRQSEDEFPRGALSLPQPPETGFDPQGKRTIEALNRHLTERFFPGGCSAFEKRFDEYMIQRFYKPSPGLERTPEQSIEAAAHEIRHQAGKGNTYYLLVMEKKHEQEQKALENVLQRIREKYPGLMCLLLNPDFDIEMAEKDSFRSLLDILPVNPGKPS